MPKVWRRGGNAGAYSVSVWEYQQSERRKGKEGVGEKGRNGNSWDALASKKWVTGWHNDPHRGSGTKPFF